VEIGRNADLYRTLPDVARTSPGIDPDGAYLRSLAETALENAATLASRKTHIEAGQAEAAAALRLLADTGDEGLPEHFNRVPEVLQVALETRSPAARATVAGAPAVKSVAPRRGRPASPARRPGAGARPGGPYNQRVRLVAVSV
jgi:hypothetical protein